jgi:hypothetical protein
MKILAARLGGLAALCKVLVILDEELFIMLTSLGC